MDDELFRQFLEQLIDDPEHCSEVANQYMSGAKFDPEYHKDLVDRIKRLDLAPATLNALVTYAADTSPTEGREWARQLLSAAWKDEKIIH